MILTKRLEKVAGMLDKCDIVADIGTDHAYLPIYIAENSLADKVIGIDLRKKPLEKAKKNVNESGFSKKIELRLGDGLTELGESEAETIIITGMGGRLITKIIENNINIAKKTKTLILQPMTNHFKLRKWLYKNNFEIIDEELIDEDFRIYLILKVRYTDKPLVLTKQQEFYGEILFKKEHILLKRYIEKTVKELKDVVEELKANHTTHAKRRLIEVEQELEFFKEVLGNC